MVSGRPWVRVPVGQDFSSHVAFVGAIDRVGELALCLSMKRYMQL